MRHKLHGTYELLCYIGRVPTIPSFYGQNAYESAKIDEWLEYAPIFSTGFEFENACNCVDKHLESRTFLFGSSLSIADIASQGNLLKAFNKFIPKSWKQSVKQLEPDDESRVDSLLNTLKYFASQGNLLKAFNTFSFIQGHASSTASHDLVLHPISHLIESCTSLRFFSQGKQLHGLIVSLGFEQNPVLVPKLVTFYAAFNNLVDAHSITESSNISAPWTVLISSYVRDRCFGEALSAYKQMVSKGIRPHNFTYPSVLKACGEENDIAFGKEIHESIDASCNGWDLFVHNALISMYGKLGEVVVARRLFDKMLERDVVSWNTIISVYASNGMREEAHQMFEKMLSESVELNTVTWNTIVGGDMRVGNFKGPLLWLSQMRARGIQLDAVAMVNGLSACSHIGSIRQGKEIHGFAIRNFCDGFDNVRNALITMYARCNDLRHAYLLFQLIEAKSISTWNSMLSGYAQMDRSEEASFMFREMLLSGITPNYVTIASILPLCARVENLQHGREFHCYITRRIEFEDKLLLWNALVNMYARSSKVLEAKRVFDSMSRRDKVTYTSLIAGYGRQGEGRAALKMFDEMEKLQIKPDHITMVTVLSACSHSGFVTEGQTLFENMTRHYGISPRLEHFACMVDLYGRAGLLHKAIEILMTIPYKPTTAMWATLLGACQIHGNTVIGEWAAEKLLEMRPENPVYYVRIASMYAAAGCWNKLAKLRTSMRDLVGCGWLIDCGGSS